MLESFAWSDCVHFLHLRALKSLVVPGGILLLGVIVLTYSGWLTLALPAITFLYYCAIGGGMLLAWKFHSSRVFLSLVLVFLAQQATNLAGQSSNELETMAVIAVLIPCNFILISLMTERGFAAPSIGPVGLFFFIQALTGAVLLGAHREKPSALIHAHHPESSVPLPPYILIVVIAAGVFFLVRFLLARKPLDSALLWSLSAMILAIRNAGAPRPSTLYWATAACILAVSIVENSYLLAYHDELTTLPSRRAFNEAVLRLKDPYTMAAVDIDHFKRFNDTHGHDVGDEVLRLVAANLARVTGGGLAYRCGGEEFTILFPGKTTSEVMDHLELLRGKIETSEFRLRGNERRQMPRGPDRRNQPGRGRDRKGDAIRRLTQQNPSALSVTVSIGVATSSARLDPEAVLKAADKALYRAKENGRNRVETASANRRSSRSKAAGIA